jgi:hypothetical protein
MYFNSCDFHGVAPFRDVFHMVGEWPHVFEFFFFPYREAFRNGINPPTRIYSRRKSGNGSN